jgi:catechol 2,3-dioxygenase-like lactoylglutathione lyase family enzyme
MTEKVISGIQQIGVGVKDMHDAWKWYRKYFGTDVMVFEEAAPAELMLPYTGGKTRNRHATLAINMQGGGGFEIWQYTDRVPEEPKFEIKIGDLGIFATKIKSKDVNATFNHYKSEKLNIAGQMVSNPEGVGHFFMRDPFDNLFQIVSGNGWFKDEKKLTGASYGAIIGVSNIENSKKVYSDILGYDTVVYDQTGVFDDFSSLPGGERKFRRVLLRHSVPRKGAFSPVLGPSEIELVQIMEGQAPRKIFQDRYWGDLGFIHLCFDIRGMQALREECHRKGFEFTVDAGDTFDMGASAGAFSYIEDPDGTLIEFVETHKVPILKKLGIYLNLRKRNPEKSLPRWMLNALSLNRVKD